MSSSSLFCMIVPMRPWKAIACGFLVTLSLAERAHAFFGIERLWQPTAPTRPAPRAPANLPGFKVKKYQLKKAKSADLEYPLQSYLLGIKSQGTVMANPAENTLIVSDDPEVLQRIDLLVKEMDQVYDNQNAMARSMLASQAMIKAVRTLNLGVINSIAARPGPRSSGGGGVVVPAAPVNVAAPSAPMSEQPEDLSRPVRPLEDRPMLRAFKVIGWVRDDEGLLVVLRNDGQRYIYRGGRLRIGSAASENYVSGVTLRVHGERLEIDDPQQGHVSLKLNPQEDRLQ